MEVPFIMKGHTGEKIDICRALNLHFASCIPKFLAIPVFHKDKNHEFCET